MSAGPPATTEAAASSTTAREGESADATTTSAPSAAEAAIALVTRTGSVEALAERARRVRRSALTWVTVSVLAFLARSVTAMMLTAWRQQAIVTWDTEPMVRFTEQNLPLMIWSTRLLGVLAIVGVVVYAVQHIRFRALWRALPLTAEARERRVRSNLAAFAPAMIMAVLGAGIYLTGELLPAKPSPKEHYSMLRSAQQSAGSLAQLVEQEKHRTVPWYVERADAASLWNLHVFVLPASWAGMILLLLIPVYSVQRARVGPGDLASTNAG